MDTIKTPMESEKLMNKLDSLQKGMPVVMIFNGDYKVVAIYMGITANGEYAFFDGSGVSGVFMQSIRFIRSHYITYRFTLEDDMEIATVSELNRKLKQGDE